MLASNLIFAAAGCCCRLAWHLLGCLPLQQQQQLSAGCLCSAAACAAAGAGGVQARWQLFCKPPRFACLGAPLSRPAGAAAALLAAAGSLPELQHHLGWPRLASKEGGAHHVVLACGSRGDGVSSPQVSPIARGRGGECSAALGHLLACKLSAALPSPGSPAPNPSQPYVLAHSHHDWQPHSTLMGCNPCSPSSPSSPSCSPKALALRV